MRSLSKSNENITNIFALSFASTGFEFDYVFDWTILKYQQAQIEAPPSRSLVSDVPLCLFKFILCIFTSKI